MLAMMLPAWSCGRVAGIYPAAGSAYTYVSRGLNAHLGFLTGWTMFLDYLIVPVINTIYIALAFQRIVPQIPHAAWAGAAALLITLLKLRRVRFTARANLWLLAVMSVVIVAFLAAAVRYLFGQQVWPGLISFEPVYSPRHCCPN